MNRKLIPVLVLATLCVFAAAQAQQEFLDSSDAYLGQPRPSDTPQVFAPGLLVDPGTVAMGRVSMTSDGKEIYYDQAKGWGSIDTVEVKLFKFDGHKWVGPTVLLRKFYDQALSPDSNTMYYNGADPHQLTISKRTKDGWSAPEILLQLPKQTYLYDPMPTKSGVFYLGSNPDAEDKKNGISLAYSTMTISGGNATIKSLGVPLNEPGFNGDFYIAPDESYIIISAKETKTYESELYISFHKPDSTWTVPVSLGPKINDGLAHRWGQYVSPDGKYLFYTRGTKSEDTAIYWVRFDKLLESLRQQQR